MTDGWYAAKCRCRICGNEQISVFPEACDETRMECGKCHQMSVEVEEYIPPEEQ